MSGKSKFVLFLSILTVLLLAVVVVGSAWIGMSAEVANWLYIAAGILVWVIIFVVLGASLWKLLGLIVAMEFVISAITYVTLGDYLMAIIYALLSVVFVPLTIHFVFKKIK